MSIKLLCSIYENSEMKPWKSEHKLNSPILVFSRKIALTCFACSPPATSRWKGSEVKKDGRLQMPWNRQLSTRCHSSWRGVLFTVKSLTVNWAWRALQTSSHCALTNNQSFCTLYVVRTHELTHPQCIFISSFMIHIITVCFCKTIVILLHNVIVWIRCRT